MKAPIALALLCSCHLALHAGDTLQTPPPSTYTAAAAKPYSDRLTGDWGGVRSQLTERGLSLDLEYTQFYQGLLSGDGNDDWDFGGRVDAFFNVDTGKLGLWQGGVLRTHAEYRYGDPLADIKLVEDPAKNFVVIMKDGVIHENPSAPN